MGGFLLRSDGEVLEMFGRHVLDSVRIPLSWVAVEFEPRT